jgi:predicted DNA-binding transcriptional regulator AlpA
VTGRRSRAAAFYELAAGSQKYEPEPARPVQADSLPSENSEPEPIREVQGDDVRSEPLAPRRSRAPRPRSRPATRLVTVSKLAQHLQVSRNVIYLLMDEGMPYPRVGDRRFDLGEVLQWLRERTARRKAAGLE